jgi:hypothetical protein
MSSSLPYHGVLVVVLVVVVKNSFNSPKIEVVMSNQNSDFKKQEANKSNPNF